MLSALWDVVGGALSAHACQRGRVLSGGGRRRATFRGAVARGAALALFVARSTVPPRTRRRDARPPLFRGGDSRSRRGVTWSAARSLRRAVGAVAPLCGRSPSRRSRDAAACGAALALSVGRSAVPPRSRRRDARPPLLRGGSSCSRRGVTWSAAHSLHVTVDAVASSPGAVAVAPLLRRRRLRRRAGALLRPLGLAAALAAALRSAAAPSQRRLVLSALCDVVGGALSARGCQRGRVPSRGRSPSRHSCGATACGAALAPFVLLTQRSLRSLTIAALARRPLRSLGARCTRSALAALAWRSLPLGARCHSALAAARRSLRLARSALGARCARSTLAALTRRSLRSLNARCVRLALAAARHSLPLGARCRSALSALGAVSGRRALARRSLRSPSARCARLLSLRSLGARYARSALAALARRSLRSLGARCRSALATTRRSLPLGALGARRGQRTPSARSALAALTQRSLRSLTIAALARRPLRSLGAR